ncbi:NAD(+)/NADH kinase [Actinacidiphila oryziradicis]|uniref:NAD kinase n=1 Tax=Actinacidiphila oryziradicis TaxID=2571141 RepID=A0A4U0RWF6_9ACTN|nr:NAD(+)/NADH kinase [Actinacidiphila oryziradicis]TJZ99937.1 NAD(+)/NADH kinase [Actinacidiphila oryziradicis]
MGLISAVGVVLHPRRDCSPTIRTITDWTRDRGGQVLGLTGEVTRIDPAAVVVTPEELPLRADLILSLGGDGTMLRAMRLAAGGDAPVLGVNVGRLGFLAEVDIPDVPDALSAIDGHRFSLEPRSGVRATIGGREELAFNDIVLVRSPGRPSAAVQLRVEGHPFVNYAADAVIVATPTGSTAYSFSAGGPIVSPSAEGLLVTPVAPHSAFNRSLFLSSGEKLALEVLRTSGELAVEADGRLVGRVCPGETVDVTMVPDAATVVRLGRTTFYQRTQRKLRIAGSAEAERAADAWPPGPAGSAKGPVEVERGTDQ